MTIRTALQLAVILLAAIATQAATEQTSGTPAAQALRQLKDGAERFATGQSIFPHQDADRIKEVVAGQKPFATILSCSDSRVPVEMIFDAGFGDLFVIRVAGNVIAPELTGTIEYGVEHLNSNLLVVLGHTKCGAVTATASGSKAEGSVATLINEIQPAVARAEKKQPSLKGNDLVSAATVENVWLEIEKLIAQSPTVRERVQAGTLRIVGAVYHLEDNQVEWLGRHPQEKELLAATYTPAESPDHEPAVAVENTKTDNPAAVSGQSTSDLGDFQGQVQALRTALNDLQAQSHQKANDSMLASLAADLAVVKTQLSALTARPNRNRPKLASTDDEFAVADNSALEKLSAQVAGIQTDIEKVKQSPVPNAPVVNQGAITFTGFVHQQYYDKSGVTKVSSFESKRVRLGAVGTINNWASIEIVGDFAKTPKLVDGDVALAPLKNLSVRFGQFRPPSGTELTRSSMALPFINYSQAMVLNTDRDLGAAFTYQPNMGKWAKLSLMAGLFNGSGVNVSDSNTAKNSAMRAELRIADHFMFAPNAYFGKTNSAAAPKNIDTYGATANWSAAGRIVESEFTYSKVAGVKKAGWYLWGGQTLKTGLKFCPEIQLVSRYERFDANLELADNATNRVTVGANFFVDKKFTLIQVNYQINGEQETSISNNELLVNAQVGF